MFWCCCCKKPTVSCSFVDESVYGGVQRTFHYTIADADTAWIIERYWSGSEVITSRIDILPANSSGSFVGSKYRIYTIHAASACGEEITQCYSGCQCAQCYELDHPNTPRSPIGFTYEFSNISDYVIEEKYYDTDGDLFFRAKEWSVNATAGNHSRFIPYDLTACEFEDQPCLYLGDVGIGYEYETYKPWYGSYEFSSLTQLIPWRFPNYYPVGINSGVITSSTYSGAVFKGWARPLQDPLLLNPTIGPWNLYGVADWKIFRDDPNWETGCLFADIPSWGVEYCPQNYISTADPAGWNTARGLAFTAASDLDGYYKIYDHVDVIYTGEKANSNFPAPNVIGPTGPFTGGTVGTYVNACGLSQSTDDSLYKQYFTFDGFNTKWSVGGLDYTPTIETRPVFLE